MLKKYKVVFDGKLKSGMTLITVKQELLRLYKGNQEVVERLLESRKGLIKRDIDYKTAQKYKAAFEKTGALCRIVEEESEVVSSSATKQAATQSTHNIEGRNSYDSTLRGILAESWHRIGGEKTKILSATLVASLILCTCISIGYGARLFFGEWGRNIPLVYALQYFMTIFAYPFLGGVIIMGVRRAESKPLAFSMVFNYLSASILLVAALTSIASYLFFILLYFVNIDHFIANTTTILVLPVFAFAVPLVVDKKLSPLQAMKTSLFILYRNWGQLITVYFVLFCVNLVGNFFLIGVIWTIPLLAVAQGILYRNYFSDETSTEVFARGLSRNQIFRPGESKPQVSPTLVGSNSQNVLAGLLIILLFISIGGRFWALFQSAHIKAPDHVAGNGEQVCIHFNNSLYFLSAAGKLQKRLALADLGINGTLADLELLKDGNVLIGDQEKGAILRCNIQNNFCKKIGPAGGYKINENFKLLVDEERELLYISDTNNHRLLVQNLTGTSCSVAESNSNIDYPNDMALDDTGHLWLSNTIHERIVPFTLNSGTAMEAGKAIELAPNIETVTQSLLGGKDPLEALADLRSMEKEDLEKMKQGWGKIKENFENIKGEMVHTRPLSLAWGSDGNLWVAASDPMITTAGLRVFDNQGEQVGYHDFEKGAIPIDVINIGETLVVADSGLFQIYSILPYSNVSTNFGDDTFQQELRNALNKATFYKTVQKWTLVSIIILAVIVGIMALFIVRQKR